jgi:RNA-directed DNA polymerase
VPKVVSEHQAAFIQGRAAKKTKMIERILSRENKTKAYRQVFGNKGCSGVDGMEVSDLKPYLKAHWEEIKARIQKGNYHPRPVMGIEIDKPKGGKRLLGIPTVLDRIIQQAIQQVLSEQFDPKFSGYSYGFRKGRNCHQAIKQALEYVNAGSHYVVDIDLSKFFDRVNHDHLMGLLAKEIGDKMLLGLISRYLQSGILIDGLVSKRTEGTPARQPIKSVTLEHCVERVG